MITEQQDLSRALASGVVETEAASLPTAVVASTRRRILDTIGVVIAGAGLGQGSRDLLAMVAAEGGAAESRVLGAGLRVPCRAAALVNGGVSHALDYDDVFSPARIHPDAVVVPAALAVAERRRGVSGAELVAAVALGDELGLRIGKAVFNAGEQSASGFPGRYWHPVLVPGYFAAAAAAGRLLDLSIDQLLDAFGIALYRAGGTLAYVKGARNLVAELYYGFPAEVGVMSALMAAHGVTGPKDAFDGEGGLFPAFYGNVYDRAALTEGFGREFELGIELKPWPAVRTSHVYIEAALRLAHEHDVRPDTIAEVLIRCGRLAMLASEPLEVRINPRTAIDAKFSIPFIVSVALTKRDVRIRDFSPEGLADPAVLAMARRIRVVHDPSLDGDQGFRGAGVVPGELEVLTTDGERHRARVEAGRGGPSNPLSDAELEAKFRDCCAHASRPMPAADVDRVIDLVGRLDTLDDVQPLLEVL